MDDRSNITEPEDSTKPATDTLAGLHPGVNTQLPSDAQDVFATRHIGPRPYDTQKMLQQLGFSSLEELSDAVVPPGIRLQQPLKLPSPESEDRVLEELGALAAQNVVRRSFIGQGYHECITPPVIQRNILENPGWYTQYTPYQAEISQGRLEALLNYQTMITDLTGMAIANASLLDEATAAAEAMSMCFHLKGGSDRQTILVASDCLPQTIAVVRTRAKPLGIHVEVRNHQEFALTSGVFAVLLQYPADDGTIHDYASLVNRVHEAGALVIVAADILSLVLLRPPGEFGADMVVGNSQRFGVPLGFGGPHAAFFATRDTFKRYMPGRLVGVSHDNQGKPALRLALQTREQHIRREKATSNICTAQVLLAIMASMYAVYHGPEGLRRIARHVHHLTRLLAAGIKHLGYGLRTGSFFDTVQVVLSHTTSANIQAQASACGYNLRIIDAQTVSITLGETARRDDVIALLRIFQPETVADFPLENLAAKTVSELPPVHKRQTPFLTHPVFNRYHSETELLRYLKRLESYDLSLTRSMIPLGSCTMKLNPTAAMLPVTWPQFSRLHPYAPTDQTEGYSRLFDQLSQWLSEITGLESVSLQPNAGSQGEYAGLLVIRSYHENRAESYRRICLIPQSAHGTNPASAVMAGFTVVPVACDTQGNVDATDLQQKAETHRSELGALMLTYPSTHGVFEEKVINICQVIHHCGGLVYMDGANMNAQVGLCRPGDIGADVCHLNLHKTFSIPHGGGGPGMAPIAVRKFLAPFLPGHPLFANLNSASLGPVAAAPWGSAGILMIPWVYIRLMGTSGLRQATQMAILNANYIAHRLESYFPVLYRGAKGLVAHECILDLRNLRIITVEDVAKRLMDYGFHAPTISWPVPNTMMVEPTESESKEELDRFCDAMIAIHAEIAEIESGQADAKNNLLKNAPHPAFQLLAEPWTRPYSRQKAAFPMPGIQGQKFWPPVGRIDNVHGDRNPMCTCAAMTE